MAEWVRVGESWMGHRPEPFIHERLWSCPLTGAGPYRGLIDERGRGLVYRQDGGYEEQTTYEADRVVVAGIVETDIEEGRPVRSVYANGDEEHYHYDGPRLVAIDESPSLWETAMGGARQDSGGRLELSYDEHGLRAIEGVWERLDEPWHDALARGAGEIAAVVVEDIKRVIEEPVDGVVSLTLTYVESGGALFDSVSLNRSRDPDSVAYPYGRQWPIGEIESGIDRAMEARWVSNAALHSIEPPQRTLLNAVAAILAGRDWTGIFTPADDFVAFIAEHDEGVNEKADSLRACNPPDRAEFWAQRILAAF